MKQFALLSYMFMFNPADTWQHTSQFESMLGNYLADYGLRGQVIKTAGNPQGTRVIYIEKQEAPPLPKVKHTTQPAGQQIRALGKKIK
jgi:hypothetical protein